MAYYSDEDILEAVRINIQADRNYRDQLGSAIQSQNDSWIKKLVHIAVGVITEIGRAVLTIITGWFIPSRPPWL